MKKVQAMLMSVILAAYVLAGCGSTGAEAQKEPEAQAQAEAQAEAEGQNEAEAEAQTETDGQSETEAEAQTEAVAQNEAPAQTDQTLQTKRELAPLAAHGRTLTGLRPAEQAEAPSELSEEEVDKMDRAMRAYTPPADSLLINNAESFYYYEQMDKDEQAIYDALLMCATDPVSKENIVLATVSVDPTSDEFLMKQFVAYYGLLYDHPELFWLYNASESDISLAAPYEQPGNGIYQVYFYFEEPFEQFEEQMTEFNQAAEDFLDQIDLTASDAEIAKQIHDKLIETVTYNNAVMLDTSEAGFSSLAHTAYGALVKDNNGNANCAVCDGYSQAYVYLLEQAGINAAMIVGVAGNTAGDTGGHAWTAVELDGEWYEVDATWDDMGSLDEAVESIRETDAFSYNYYREALDDPEYRAKLEHYLCNITTPEIEHFVPDDYFDYVTADQQYIINLTDESVHVRASNETQGYEFYGLIMNFAPVATGTLYSIR